MQPARLLGIKTPLPGDPLTLTRLSVTEEVGATYTIEAEVLGTDVSLQPKDLMTKEVTCSVEQRVGDTPVIRHFHGVVVGFERLGPGLAGRMAYRLVAVPEIWRLDLSRDCRIFQDMSAKAIIEQVFQDRGIAGTVTWGMTGDATQPIPYCTQFNESDLAFVSRLLEEHGLGFYFVHAEDAHELRISATAQGFPQFAEREVQALHDSENFLDLTAWRRVNRARPAEVSLRDMDAERSQPSVTTTATKATRAYRDEAAMAVNGVHRRWPGGMGTHPAAVAEVLMGAMDTASESYAAETRDPRYAAGVRLNVAMLAEDGTEVSRQYVVTAVRHEAADTSGIVAGAGGVERYAAHLTLVAADRPWMPQPRHPRPVMAGLYAAKVTGPEAEQIHTDEFGRIKVLFRWDHLGKDKDTSSCWVRVMQSVAGAWGGAWFLPRVGDEVMVAFLEGDPDRPIVVGSVYGKDGAPPFGLTANKSMSGYRTRSYKSDSREDANILRFEDKKDSEEVLLHAQKDLTVEAENNETRTVGAKRTTTVTGKDLGGADAEIYTLKDGHRTETIEKGDDTYLLKQGNRTHTIRTGDDTYSLDTGNRTHTIKTGNDELAIKTGNLSTKIDMGNETRKLGMGNYDLKCDLGAVTIEAMQSITLKVGQNSVKIDQTGVTISGIMVKVEGTAMVETKAPMAQHSGDGMMTIKGGIVLIN